MLVQGQSAGYVQACGGRLGSRQSAFPLSAYGPSPWRAKEGLFDAVVDRERTRIATRREVPDGADLHRRIEILVNHYEEDGDVVLHLLSEEDRSPEVALVVAEGRRTHRTWVENHLPEILASARGAEHRQLVDAAVAATDLLTWAAAT